MNQPKFKFGEKCLFKNCVTLTVDAIAFEVTNSDGSGEYKYNHGFWESELELYTEPKPKKLLRVLARDNDCDVYLIPEYLFESAEQAKKFLKEDNRVLSFVKVLEEINYSDKE